MRNREEYIDFCNKEISKYISRMLVKERNPKDSQYMSVLFKVCGNLERIGDQASDIAGITGYIEDEQLKSGTHIYEMARAASRMVTDSVDSFVRKDLGKARAVQKEDDIVDGLFDTVKNELVGQITEHPDLSGECPDLLMIAKYLERIGDHAADIAEIIPHLVTVRKEGDAAVSQAIAMGKKAHQMILDALAALTAEDENAARRVIAADDAVDYDFNAIKHQLAQEIAEDPARWMQRWTC